MKKGLFRAILEALPLRSHDKQRLESIRHLFSDQEFAAITRMLKSRQIRFATGRFETSEGFLEQDSYLMLAPNVARERVHELVAIFNQRVEKEGKQEIFERFAPDAERKIMPMIAPTIVGMLPIKKAALLHLFAKEKLHILLLGDPSTGKTVILRGVSDLAPVSSFGLGSGSSKAGLTVSFAGKEMVKGLLPLADEGVACIDELNLMKSGDRAGLLNAMEKGFITYDKGTSHVQVEARVKVFASANPEGDRFVGRTVSVLKKQIPFEPALLSRFHLVFLIRRPSDEEFLKITDQIVRNEHKHVHEGDKRFVREYVAYALEKEVSFDKSLSTLIQGFMEDVRKDEDRFIVEISPRMVVGIINLAKASARMRLKDKVEKEDLITALKIFNSALYIKKDELEK